MFSITILSVILVLGLVSVDHAFAQSPDETIVIREELVHRVVNGTFVVERDQVQMTRTSAPPSAAGDSQPDTRPWHILQGFESKINPTLQQEIDNKKKICTFEMVFDDCPSLDKNADGKDVINVAILLPQIEMWPDGWPNPDKYPTKDQIRDRLEDVVDDGEDVLQPVVEFLESNNQTIIEQHALVIVIYADVTLDFLPELIERDDVLFIESRNVILKTQLFESKQVTGIEQTKALSSDGSNTIVAVIDTGLDIVSGSYRDVTNTATPRHEDLSNQQRGVSKLNKIVDVYTLDGNNPDDCNGHGTAVAGIISGTGAANFAYSGYAPDSILNVYKISQGCGQTVTASIMENAIQQAMQDNVDVINLSLAPTISSRLMVLETAADMAFDMGIAVVAAVGNDGRFGVDSPARAHKVLGVGASSQSEPNTKMSYSNFGKTDGRIKPDLVAPVDSSPSSRDGLTSTTLGARSYAEFSGTSFAAPQVSGAIADLIEKYDRRNTEISPGRLYAIMLSQATGDERDSGGLRMDDRIGAGALSMRYNTLETRSGEFSFTSGGSFTIPINIPSNAERLTVSLWWPEGARTNDPNIDLEVSRGSVKVASSTLNGPVSQRVVIDNPVTGNSVYNIKINVGTPDPGQIVHYAYTSTLSNEEPTTSVRGSPLTVDAGASIEIPIRGNDLDRDIVTFFVSRDPSRGSISPDSGPNRHLPNIDIRASMLTYSSNSNARGTDSFQITPWDGKELGSPVTFNLLFSTDQVPPTATTPDPVDDFAHTLDGTNIHFTWSHPYDGGSEIRSYIIERLTPSGTWVLYMEISETNTSYDSSGPYGLDRQFRIFANNQLGVSPPSNVVSVSIPDITPPDVRINRNLDGATTRSSTFEISGTIFEDENTPIESIRIFIDGTPITDPVIFTSGNQLRTPWSSTITGLENGTHTIRVSATHIDGLVGSDSITITATIPIPKVLDSFTESFETGLDEWVLTTENPGNDWRTTPPLDAIPDTPTDNTVARAADCDNICNMAMIDTVDLSQMEEPTLSFYRFVNDRADEDEFEGIIVNISTNGGNSWIVLDSFLASDGDNDETWHFEEYDLERYGSDQIKLRFDAITSSRSERVELDSIRIFDQAEPEFVIMAPSDRTFEATANSTMLTPEQIGNATAIMAISITSNAPASFPLGNTTITWTATDDSGNNATDTQIITVQDTTPPEFDSVPQDRRLETSGDTAVLDYVVPTATDLIDEQVDVSCIPQIGTQISLGNTTVTCTATDDFDNSNAVTFVATVSVNQPPTIKNGIQKFSIMEENTARLFLNTKFSDDGPLTYTTVIANSTVVSVQIQNNVAIMTGLATGITSITACANDGINEPVCQDYNVTVTEKLTITAPDDLTAEATAPLTVLDIGTATANNNTVITNDAPDAFPLGDTTVTWIATDSAESTVTDTQLVTIQDTTPPKLDALRDVRVLTIADAPRINYNDLGVTDLVDGPIDASCDPPRGTSATFGIITITCTATDDSGNSGTGSFDVTVGPFDNERISDVTTLIEITAPDDLTAEATAPLSVLNIGTATAQDANGDLFAMTSDAPVSFPLGETVVTWAVTDSGGNDATYIQLVTIQDTTIPEFYVLIDGITTLTYDAGGTTVDFETPQASDNTDLRTSCSPASGQVFPIGVTPVSCTATDEGGNSAVTSFDVTIRLRNDPPVMTAPIPDFNIPMSTLIQLLLDTNFYDVDKLTYTVTIDSPDIVLILIYENRMTLTTLTPGSAEITVCADDGTHEPVCQMFVYTVIALDGLTIGVPNDITAEATGPLTELFVGFAYAASPDDPNPVITNDAPDAFPLGTTTVTWTATDRSGNISTDTQTVTIVDRP